MATETVDHMSVFLDWFKSQVDRQDAAGLCARWFWRRGKLRAKVLSTCLEKVGQRFEELTFEQFVQLLVDVSKETGPKGSGDMVLSCARSVWNAWSCVSVSEDGDWVNKVEIEDKISTKKRPKFVRSAVYTFRKEVKSPHERGVIEDEEEIAVMEFDVQPASVGRNFRETISMGGFETVNIGGHVEIPCYLEEVPLAWEEVTDFLQQKMETEVREMRQLAKKPVRRGKPQAKPGPEPGEPPSKKKKVEREDDGKAVQKDAFRAEDQDLF
jgi:hypothetical protein